jgi:hypothetical protein
MRSPRYTILVANRDTGAVRRLTVVRRTGLLVAGTILFVPLLMGLGASGADPVELESLRLANESLRIENESYRAATGELAEQISSLQSALTQLGNQAGLDPAARQALEKLPAVIRSRAAGGGAAGAPARVDSPDTTIGVLKGLLGAIENRIATVKSKVAGCHPVTATARIRWTALRTSTRASTSRPAKAHPCAPRPMAWCSLQV